MMKSIPQLKDYFPDKDPAGFQNKHLNVYRLAKYPPPKKSKDEPDLMQGLPPISPGKKLEAYLKSASTSNEMSREMTSEFADLVNGIINIEEKSFEAF